MTTVDDAECNRGTTWPWPICYFASISTSFGGTLLQAKERLYDNKKRYPLLPVGRQSLANRSFSRVGFVLAIFADQQNEKFPMNFDDEHKRLNDEAEVAAPEIVDESPRLRANSVFSPRDSTGRGAQLQLLMLMAMLVVVIFAMTEVGKPERWAWLGLDEPTVKLAQDPALDQRTSIGEQAEVPAKIAKFVELSDTTRAPEPVTPYPPSAQRFCVIMVRKFNAQQQAEMFRFLRALRTSQRWDPANQPAFESLVQILSQQRQIFHRDLLDQLTVLPAGSEAKTKLADEIFEFEQSWGKKLLPAFEAALAGQDFTVSQLSEIERLQAVLDPLIFAEVQDHTSIGWEGDSPAWVRMWEQIVNGELAKPSSASHLQLSSQPEYYRGRSVQVGGWVQSARREIVDRSELGFPHYYVLLVRPVDSKVSPYYVYALNLPADFPEVSENYSALNERIEASGLFFKVRTYLDAAKKVSESPIILARTITCVPDVQAENNAVSAFELPTVGWIAILVLLPLLAAGIAWRVFQNSKTPRFQPGLNTTKKINQTLSGLVHDPNVQTDVEKIRELYD